MRGQLSSAPMQLAESVSAGEEDGMAVRGVSMAREWPSGAVMLPALSKCSSSASVKSVL